jgi:RNA polymerase sigma factor (sigma-70 family)
MESISRDAHTQPLGARATTSAKNADAPDLTNLIERIAGGDRDALGELYDLTVSKLFALAHLILQNSADAEEIVCDVYTQVWQSAARYQGERGAVMGWLLVICRTRALDLNRRNRLRARLACRETPPADEEPQEQIGPEDILDLIKLGTAVHEALTKLTPLRRRLVALAFFKGLSHGEIAAACRLPVGTVKSHIRRALAELRAELAEAQRDGLAEGCNACVARVPAASDTPDR